MKIGFFDSVRKAIQQANEANKNEDFDDSCDCCCCTWNQHVESLIARRELIAAAYAAKGPTSLAELKRLLAEDLAEHQAMLVLEAAIKEQEDC